MDLQKQAAQNSSLRGFSASNLCTHILNFWCLVLQQETWGLAQPAGPLGSRAVASSRSSVADEDEDYDMDCNEMEEPTVVLDESSPKLDVGVISEYNVQDLEHRDQASWNMARFLLNEERDRLCLWIFNFSDGDLDRVVCNSGISSNIFGGAILEALVSIGDALLQLTDIGKQGLDDAPTDTGRHQARQDLKLSVRLGQEIVKHMCYAHSQIYGNGSELWTTCNESEWLSGTGSLAKNTLPEDEVDAYSVLKSSIVTLQGLSFSILQTLEEIDTETTD